MGSDGSSDAGTETPNGDPGATASRGVAPPHARLAIFHRSLREFFLDLPTEARRFWVMVMLTGAAAGLAATGFLHLLRLVQLLAWPRGGATFYEAVSAASSERRVIVPTLAGLLVTGLWLATGQKLSGHGTPGVIEAIWRKEGRLSLPRAVLRDAASIIAVAMGASLGREGALIQTGAGTGSFLGARLKLSSAQTRLLCACGAAAGISAAYNVPIGGAVFGLEVLLGSFALEAFGPIVIACVMATMVSRVLIENHPTYVIPHYTLMTPRDLSLMLLLGPVLGAASGLYVKGLDGISQLLARTPRRLAYALPVVVLGLLGLAAVRFPELLGNGYDTVNRSLLGEMPLGLLVLLPFLKFVATSLCSAGGVPGGLFTPSLYVGALLGGALGVLANRVWPGGTPAGAYALVGMGCVLAGTTHAAVSSVLILFELTQDYDVILPVMVSCVLAAAVSRQVERESIYTSALRRRHVVLPETPRPEWLRERKVHSLARPDHATVPAATPFAEVLVQLLALPAGRDLYVTDADGRYLGVIVLDALKGHIPDRELLPMIVAADVMDASVVAVPHDALLAHLASRFVDCELDKLPVVDAASGRLVGIVAKGQMLALGRFA